MPDIKAAIIVGFQEFALNYFNICIADILRLLLLTGLLFSVCLIHRILIHANMILQKHEVFSLFFSHVLKFRKNFEAYFCLCYHQQLSATFIGEMEP